MDRVVDDSLDIGPLNADTRLDFGLAEEDARWLFQVVNRAWVRHNVHVGPDGRSRRTAVNLALLRAPLAGVDLDSRDHAILTWLADHDADVVAGVHNLLDRARAAGPTR